MQTIGREEVKRKIDNDAARVIEVLPEPMFNKFHLPGAINVPYDDGFDALIRDAVPDKDEEVIVYCKDEECDASPKAAQRMDELGYRNVFDYEAGKEDWQAAGLPTER